MALTLTQIQALVQFYANDSTLSISSGTNLVVANLVYQDLAGKRRWPESTQTATPIQTVAGQENYRWPITPLFKEEPYVDWLNIQANSVQTIVSATSNSGQLVLQVASAANLAQYDTIMVDYGTALFEVCVVNSVNLVSNPNTITCFSNLLFTHNINAVVRAEKGVPYRLLPAYNEDEWSRLSVVINGWPSRYRRLTINNTPIFALRPVPTVSGNLIRLTGLIQVTDLAAPSDATIFIEKNNDIALACLIAAEFKFKRKEKDQAVDLITRANELLPEYDINPPTQRGRIASWGGGSSVNNGTNPTFGF